MGRLFNDAASEYLQATTAVVGVAPFTFSVWFYPDDGDTGNQNLLSLSLNSSNVDFANLTYAANLTGDPIRYVSRSAASGQQAVQTANSVVLNTWQHAAVRVVGASERYVYLNMDTANRGSDTTTINLSGLNRTTIGGYERSTGPTQFFSGALAEVAVWNVALTEAELVMLYRRRISPRWLRHRRKNLVFYKPLFSRHNRRGDIGPLLTRTGTAQFSHPHQRKFYLRRPVYVPAAAGTVVTIDPASAEVQAESQAATLAAAKSLTPSSVSLNTTAAAADLSRSVQAQALSADVLTAADSAALSAALQITPASSDVGPQSEAATLAAAKQVSPAGADITTTGGPLFSRPLLHADQTEITAGQSVTFTMTWGDPAWALQTADFVEYLDAVTRAPYSGHLADTDPFVQEFPDPDTFPVIVRVWSGVNFADSEPVTITVSAAEAVTPAALDVPVEGQPAALTALHQAAPASSDVQAQSEAATLARRISLSPASSTARAEITAPAVTIHTGIVIVPASLEVLLAAQAATPTAAKSLGAAPADVRAQAEAPALSRSLAVTPAGGMVRVQMGAASLPTGAFEAPPAERLRIVAAENRVIPVRALALKPA